MLQIDLLGGFHLRYANETITTVTVPRLQSLLAYLVLHREAPQFRQHLAFLFWPDSTEAQARTNLRRALYDLRLALPDAEQYLAIHTQWIQWRPSAAFILDLDEFEALLAQAEQLVQGKQPEQATAQLERAIALYHGPFLLGGYDDWVLVQREEVAQHFGQALEHLIQLLESGRDYPTAIHYAQRLLRHDPLAETTYQRLMRLHALNGDRAGALRVYHECAGMLSRELGVEPSAETRAAYAQLFREQAAATLPVEEPVRSGDSPVLIGRESEWQQLLLAWQHAGQGRAQVVAISGEVGIGKTRLAETLTSWVHRQGARAAGVRAYAAEGGLAYAPLIDLLRTETLTPGLAALSKIRLAHVARLLPELLDQHPDLAQVEPANDATQRQHFFEALAGAVLADGRPLLIVIDDLHWCDRETLEWLHYLLRFAPQARLLLVVTVRSGEAEAGHPLHAFLHSLHREHRLTEMTLNRLTRANTAALAAQLAGRALETDQVTTLYRQTEGNPLFVVEMVRAEIAAWAAGGDHAPGDDGPALPASVQAVIEARLARLTPLALEVAGVAAVIGRALSLDVLAHGLAHGGGYSEDQLVAGLDELWQRHILREAAANEYDFSHPRIREVAYRQLSPMRRRHLHRRAAQALEAVSGERADAVSGLIASHYELAGDAEQAVHAYQRGAAFAKQAYAYVEAVEQLRRGLALLQTLPDGESRRRQELEFQLDLGWALMMAKGWIGPEPLQAYSRALELCAEAGAEAHVYEAIWGLHEIYLFQGNLAKAREASEHCWRLAQQSGDPERLVQAHHCFWSVYFWFCDEPDALHQVIDHVEQGIALYRPEWHRTYVLHYGGSHDPSVCARNMAAKAEWLLGYPDRAIERQESAVALARQLGHPSSLAMTLHNAAKVYCYLGQSSKVLDVLEQGRLLDSEGRETLTGEDLALYGWAVGQTASPDAVELIREGIAQHRTTWSNLDYAFNMALLAETCERCGQTAAALAAVEEGLALVHATGEGYWRSELHRLHGRCMLDAGDVNAAQASFRQALEIAQQQKAKSLELRAAMDLSDLWANQGQRARARDLLAGVYHWFTEGFDTADLRQAKVRLLALAH